MHVCQKCDMGGQVTLPDTESLACFQWEWYTAQAEVRRIRSGDVRCQQSAVTVSRQKLDVNRWAVMDEVK